MNKDKRRGIIGTIIVHVLLLLCLFFIALRTPLPLPGEEGVEVNLGYDDKGYGQVQSDVPPPKAEPEPVQQKVVQPPPQPEPEPAEEEFITQETEEAPPIEEEVVKEDVTEPEEEVKEEPKEEPVIEEKVEEKPVEEIVDSAMIAEEIVEDTPVIEDPKPVVNKRALYTGSSSTDGEGTPQGITEGAGDQGKPHGYKDVDDYTGQGGSGNGISFSLGGRGSLFLEKPTAKFNEQGTVVVNIWVDRDGKVQRAQVSARGTTVVDPDLKKIAVDAAYNSTFAKDNNAAELQRGTITYNFVLMK